MTALPEFNLEGFCGGSFPHNINLEIQFYVGVIFDCIKINLEEPKLPNFHALRSPPSPDSTAFYTPSPQNQKPCCSRNSLVILLYVQDVKVIAVWFQVDARPFKQALLTTVKRWSLLFKQHLIDHVTNRSLITSSQSYAMHSHSCCTHIS